MSNRIFWDSKKFKFYVEFVSSGIYNLVAASFCHTVGLRFEEPP